MKIAAIIIAYNKKQTVTGVVGRAEESGKIEEVIMADDGSSGHKCLHP